MKLCSNRPEGFGPTSTLAHPLPTTCFVDTILIPLPIWLALALLPTFLLISARHLFLSSANPTHIRNHSRTRQKRTFLSTTTSIIYYLLILALVLMQTLEIVRLSLLHFGIALLPFTYVGLVLACGLHFSQGARGRLRSWQWQAVNGVVWVGGLVMCVVKVVGLNREETRGERRRGTKYPVSDQITDVAVMAGLYAALAVLEVVLGFWRAARGVRTRESVASGSDLGGEMEVWTSK